MLLSLNQGAHLERQSHLDGLRGLAAANVALFHFIRAYTPGFLDPSDPLQYLPVSAIWNGRFAVVLFFVLSGYLFFSKYYRSPPVFGVIAGIKRYARLSLPVLPLVLITWVIHAAGLFQNTEAAALSGSDWLDRWYRFEPSLGFALTEPLYYMYVSFHPIHTYNSNLWTMSYELFVVWLVIALAVFCRYLPTWLHAPLLIGAAFVLGLDYALSFIAGAGLALLGVTSKRALSTPTAIGVLIAALFLASYFSLVPRGHVLPLWQAGAVLMIFATDRNPTLRTWLSSPFPAWLGKLSFGIYLCHFVLLSSLCAWIYVGTGSTVITALSYAVSLAVCAYLFWRWADEPAMALINRFSARLRDALERARLSKPASGET